MESFQPAITPETELFLQSSGGPLEITGQQGKYVVMRLDVYAAMLGISDNDEAETLAAVREGIADVDAGRVYDPKEVIAKLKSRYAP
jgi:hypothetical protein